VKTGQLEAVQATPATETTNVPSVWRPALTIAALCALALILVYAGTYWSMVSIWWRSDTFAHGFFILPISLYLVWTEKEELRELKPMPDWKGIVAVAALGFGWLLARLANVLVVEQYLAVASLVAVLYAVLGPAVCRRVAFPLAFLLFSVPIGEALIPTLIDHTTAFAVWALQLAGIPVLRNGNVLTLPNGVWSVVEACSGLRYLIACITIGLPFAYLMYSSWKRRAAFVALSVVVPIVANWVRAFMIIWLGYVSDMRLAKGVDHLIYGWVLYAVIMFLLLWVGSLFRDDTSSRKSQGSVPSASVWPRSRTIAVGTGAVVCALLFPIWAVHAQRAEADPSPSSAVLALPDRFADYAAVDGGDVLGWEPEYVGADSILTRTYQGGGGRVTLQLAFYRHQRQGAELVSSRNLIVRPGDDAWKQIEAHSERATGPGTVDERVLRSDNGNLLVWRWYWVGGHLTTSRVWAKVIEGGRKLLGRPTPAAGIVLWTPTGRDIEPARRLLNDLSSPVVSDLEQQLEKLDE
jgi:exosortase A